jgi:transcription termination factor NusB
MSVPRRKASLKKHKNSHAREVALQSLFQLSLVDRPVQEILQFGWLNEPMEAPVQKHAEWLIRMVDLRRDHFTEVLRELSHKDLSQLSTIVRCVLMMGMAELDRGELEADVILDDILNLTRTYDGSESVGFVNGVLDAYMERQGLKRRAPAGAPQADESD